MWEAETRDVVATARTLCAPTLLNAHAQTTVTKVVVLDDKKARKCHIVTVRPMKFMNLKSNIVLLVAACSTEPCCGLLTPFPVRDCILFFIA